MSFFSVDKTKAYTLKGDAIASNGHVTECYLATYTSSNSQILGVVNQTPSNTFSQTWGFFEVSENTYILGNYDNGLVLNLPTPQDPPVSDMPFPLTTINDQTLLVTPYLGENGKIALSVDNANGYLIPIAGSYLYLQIVTASSLNDAALWDIEPVDTVNIDLPDLNQPTINMNKPTYNGEVPPLLYPQNATDQSAFLSEVYVPYCFVNDPSLTPTQKIQNSPYYLLKQYGQYQLALSLNNSTAGTVTMVEDWQNGWSAAATIAFSLKFGFEITQEVEVSAFVAKGKLSTKISTELGLSISSTVSMSRNNTKQFRVDVLPNTKVALYGLTTCFELFQMNSATSVSGLSDRMQIGTNFLTITDTNVSPQTDIKTLRKRKNRKKKK